MISVGRIVHYRLTADDVDYITFAARVNGNAAAAHSIGQVVPFIVTNVTAEGVNGRALIDGNFDLWRRSIRERDPQISEDLLCVGTWQWPNIDPSPTPA